MGDPKTSDKQVRVAFFDSVVKAEDAVHRLLANGFSKDELGVICPRKFEAEFHPGVRVAERPGSHTGQAMLRGGALGAVGGIALTAAALTTGGLALIPAAPVLIGGGAFAGVFSGLIAEDGYGKGIGEYYDEAMRKGEIVVGVEVHGPHSAERLEKAGQVFAQVGTAKD